LSKRIKLAYERLQREEAINATVNNAALKAYAVSNTENDNSLVIHHSDVMASLVFSDVLEDFIRSKNCVLSFTADRYSLHKCRETMLC